LFYQHYSQEILRGDIFSFLADAHLQSGAASAAGIEKYFLIFAEFAVRFPQPLALLGIPAHGTPGSPRACRAIWDKDL
jgi:hypothetical protein